MAPRAGHSRRARASDDDPAVRSAVRRRLLLEQVLQKFGLGRQQEGRSGVE